MSRRQRLSIAATPELREAIERVRESLLLPTEAAAAHWLLTWAVRELTREEAPQLAAHGRGRGLPIGGQTEANGQPLGDQAEAERLPRGGIQGGEDFDQPGMGEESEGGAGAAGGQTEADGLPLPADQLDREVEACLVELQLIEGWPAGRLKDQRLLRELIAEFPRADPLEVARRLKTGAIDKPIKPTGARNRLRTYFARAESMGQVRQVAAAPRAPVATEYDAPPGLEE